ncbi:hypothetical protein PLESTB_000275200 [Pleodorina starrii]|uniref:Uncharacterized protein n=1 Tax=Pleodorina starrii TaxID=330485 RepID=A0A9W6BCM1_9CHLO|nr:hypothetical protein PLESTM_001414900 [Pleodorina starrii]GLC49682.1 hypothetical protein PLESTB_000275200 [Pleodorina starrii]GLC65505.1 hypothetical protein PLESTF_000304000 [Pleodorina starrii]
MAQAHSAVDYGRQRSLLQSAQSLVAELRALPLDPATTRASYPRMFELVRMVKRYSEATAALPADETRAMWEQRGQWLQEEVAGLAQERIYSPDQQQYWLNLLLLLFAGAEACDRALREKLELELSLQSQSRQVADLQEALRAAREEAEQAAQRTSIPPDLAEELLALRSKTAVLGRELDRGRGELAAAQQQMQLLVAERDSLQQQLDGLKGELTAAQDTAASRLEVIQQLMERTETSSSQGQAAAAELSRLQVHCRTLSVNLETNAKVIEKLVELNSELMDSLNTATASAEMKVKGQQTQQQPGSAGGAAAAAATAAGAAELRRASGSGGAHDGVGMADGGGASTSGVVPRVPSWTQRNGYYGAGAAAAAAAPPPPGLAANGAAAGVGVPRVPSRGGGLAAASTSSRGGEPESLTEAFAAFLRDETPAKPATAAVLATPPPPPAGAAGSHQGGSGGAGAKGRRGLGFGIMGVVRYVAGSDRPAQQGTAGGPGAGSPPSNGEAGLTPGAAGGGAV